MEFQILFNVGAGVVLAAFGWFARELWSAVKDLQKDHASLREHLAAHYPTREDFTGAIREVKELLTRIDNKLDRKQDK